MVWLVFEFSNNSEDELYRVNFTAVGLNKEIIALKAPMPFQIFMNTSHL